MLYHLSATPAVLDNIKTNVGNSKSHHVGGPISLQIKQNVSNQLLVYEKSRYLKKGTLYASNDKCLHTWLKCTLESLQRFSSIADLMVKFLKYQSAS
jgi:hypothetical protein